MALNKTLSFKGTTISYHKISQEASDFRGGNTQFTLSSYFDQATRIADINDILAEESYTLSNATLEGDVREAIYAWLKANIEKYSDSIDS